VTKTIHVREEDVEMVGRNTKETVDADNMIFNIS